MKHGKILLILFAALLLAALLGACGEGILPPKETAAATPAPMPTPTPTPMPTPFTGEITMVEIAQAYDEDGVCFATDELVARRDTAVYVWLSSPLGHAPDERDSLAISSGGALIGVFSADESSTEDCLRYYLTGETAEALEAGSYTFSAVADDAQANARATLKDTRALKALLVPVLGNFSGSTSYPAEGWQAVTDRVQDEFPLANDGIKVVTAPGLTLSAEDYDLHTGEGLVRAWEALRERAGLLEGYDLILGVVNGGLGPDGASVCFGRDGIALLDASQEGCGTALCSFAAQSLGVPEIQDGAWRWKTLYEDFSAPQPEAEWSELLRVSGLLWPDGSFAARPLYAGPAFGAGRTATPADDSGSYALVFGDADGAELARIAFTPDFLWQGENAPMLLAAPIELTAEIPEDAASLRLVGPVQDEESGETAEGELWFSLLAEEAYVSSFSAVPNAEALSGTARVEWEAVVAEAEEPEDEAEAEPEKKDDEEEESEPAPEPPEPYYELYMCYDDMQLLVYRGGLLFGDLDMPSLPKPEAFFFKLLTAGGRASTLAVSPVLTMQ